jgi:hypothetical protein
VAGYSDEELRFEIQKQMGDCVVTLDRFGLKRLICVQAVWPDGAVHAVDGIDTTSDGWQSRLITAAVSKLTAWRDIQVLEGRDTDRFDAVAREAHERHLQHLALRNAFPEQQA